MQLERPKRGSRILEGLEVKAETWTTGGRAQERSSTVGSTAHILSPYRHCCGHGHSQLHECAPTHNCTHCHCHVRVTSPKQDLKALRLQRLLLVSALFNLTVKKKKKRKKIERNSTTQHKDSFCISGSGIKCCLQGRAHIAMVTCSNPSQWVFLGEEDDTGGRASAVPVDGVIPAIRKRAGSQPSFAGCFTSNLCSEPSTHCKVDPARARHLFPLLQLDPDAFGYLTALLLTAAGSLRK